MEFAGNNILLIINPVAGRRTAQNRMFRIVDMLTKSGAKTIVFTTSQKGDATEIAKHYGNEADRVICCGGDGTLSEVITGLETANLKVPIGYIPTGTTNDFAHAVGLPTNLSKAIHTAINGNAREHDIGKFNNNEYFSYVASFGAFVKASYGTPQWAKNAIGPVSYLIGGIAQIGEIRPHSLEVIADGRVIEGNFIFGSVSNTTIVGGVIKFPKSDIYFDDGLFEVMLIKNPTALQDVAAALYGLLISREYKEDNVLFFKAKKIKFTFKEHTQWTIDGEYGGGYRVVCIENQHRAAQIIMP